MLLTGIKLINWHYFTDEHIPIAGSALITGNNKAGKSTLIDALQVVIVSNMRKIMFNSAAFDEKTARDLKGYLRGRTGTEGKYTYLRGNDEDFSSYIVLEFTRSSSNESCLIGAVFDYYCDTGEEDHVFFKIENCRLREHLFLQDGYPRNREQFVHYMKARGLNFRQYRNDLEGYRNDLRQLFGGIKESFFSLFVKGISFKPITNLRTFIYSYILDERPVDVDTMRDYAERYRQMETQLLNTGAEIMALEEEYQAYEKVEHLRRQEAAGRYMLHRGDYEQKVRGLDEAQQQCQQSEERLQWLLTELGTLEAGYKKLTAEKEQLIEKINGIAVVRQENKLKQQIGALTEQIAKLEQKQLNLLQQVKADLRDREKLVDILSLLQAPGQLTEALKEDERAWKMFMEAGFFPAEPDKHTRSWNESMKWLIVQAAELKKQRETVQKQAQELAEVIRNLGKNRVLNNASATMKLKKMLEEQLTPREGQSRVPVDILCEAIDIRDRRWQNAIEGYLSTQKFDLLVPPGYFDRALSIYERRKFTHGMENVGLVNTDKLVKEVKPPLAGSLAEEISADKEHIRAYANWLLGGLIKCSSETEFKRHKRAITATCMVYQNYTARQIPHKRYEVPYIGAQAVKLQLAVKQEELRKCQQELTLLNEKIKKSDSVLSLNSDKHYLYQQWLTNFEQCKNLDQLEWELVQTKQELLHLDRSELELLEKAKEGKELELRQCEKEIAGLNTEKGQVQAKLELLEQQLRQLAGEKDAACRKYLAYLDTLADELKETCEAKWERESQQRSPAELAHNYYISIQGLETKIKNSMDQVVNARHDFNKKFDFLADVTAADNEKYAERLHFLKDIHLPEYSKKAGEAREKAEQALKEHFLSRLHEAIKLAYEEIDELNFALQDLKFGSYSYRFSLSPKPELREFYEMIEGYQLGSTELLFSTVFQELYGDSFSRLFEEITSDSQQDKLQELTDYRSYLDFDIIITDDRGNKTYFSKVSRTESGGGAQIPFYVAILASFYQVYHLYRNKEDTLRLVVFDEAFNRMDADNVEECMRFIRKLGFQVLIVEPTGKIQLVVPFVNTNIIVMREGFNSFVERVTCREIEQWVEHEQQQSMAAGS
ncbi:Uncharacterized protein YPO0396 [Desulfotomaculum arcticum]|uniref:Uncharacterized protein YPO0396 n=1 Tax=Desulfotruncus arcticus DSM 17038 TaxID=1121424 RepID=A0A1I2PFQ0_9FIRM|nr:SbcC/MukB-like Walker B domain-containing protein [Desulfotruncus arcticus]SFG14894.1 Uncharacterized protein YPO0396 [Desulfotomaculum arcticum] [Desulfotruncus arcticus DSM 17038]